MQRRKSGEEVDLKVEGIITITMAVREEAANMVGATSAEEVGGGKGTWRRLQRRARLQVVSTAVEKGKRLRV